MLSATIVAGTFVLVPADLDDLARSTVSVLLLGSNFYFEANTGYFDGGAATKALLHTWSLSVEGQFYLVWPLVLVTLGRSRVWVLLFARLGSLILAVADPWSPLSAFYSPFSRVYEFAIGSAVAVVLPPLRGRGTRQASAIAGIALIGLAAATIGVGQAYPSAVALIPTLGAALLIAGGPGTWVGAALEHRLVAAIGRRSYTLYLVHWPVLVLTSYGRFAPPAICEKGLLLLSVIVISELIYRSVEAPMQRTSLRKPEAQTMFRALASAAVAIIVFCGSVAATAVFARRFPAYLRESDTAVIYQVNNTFGRSKFSIAAAARVTDHRRLASCRPVQCPEPERRLAPQHRRAQPTL